MRLEDEIQQKVFVNPEQKVIVNIAFTHFWLAEHLRVLLKPYELTLQQYNILRILRGQHPNPCTVLLLKERMMDKNSDASRIVERMRLKGLLERMIRTNDRRAVDVLISEKGLQVLKEIDALMTPQNQNLFCHLTHEECETLSNLLDKLRG